MSHSTDSGMIPTQYWRASLSEVGLLHPKVPEESRPIQIGKLGDSWRVTAAEPSIPEWVRQQFAASKTRGGVSSAHLIPFVLIAARLSDWVSHGVKREAGDLHQGLSVLCVPCLLDHSGGLWPDPERSPWIPRDLLEPTLKFPAIGQLDSQDRFFSNLPGKANSFDDTLRIGSQLFEFVTGARLPSLPVPFDAGDDLLPPIFALDGYALVPQWHGIPYEPPVIAKHLIKLYDQIACAPSGLPLLESLRTTADRPSHPPLAVQDAKQWHTKTIGHINRKHPLSPSQREAMVELARLDEGHVLAVNGPPGTGKTTLLQSVVAQLWAEAALREAQCPLILVTSTNVKAVENVLESFGRICSEIGHERWHPYDGGFGLFLASESRESQHPTCTGRNHPYSDYEKAEKVEAAETYFLERASAFFKCKHDSVEGAVKALHGRLRDYEQKLKRIIAARHHVFRVAGENLTEGAVSSCQRSMLYYREQIHAEQSRVRAAEQEIAMCAEEEVLAAKEYETKNTAIFLAEKEWNAYLARSPLWLDLFGFVPAVKRRRMARDRHFLMSNPLTADRQHRDDDIRQCFDAARKAALERKSIVLTPLAARRSAAENRKDSALKRCQAGEQAWSKINKAYQDWKEALADEFAGMLDVSLKSLDDPLDTALRAHIFALTDWYWSGRWLLEMKDRLEKGVTDSKGRARLEAKYRRFSKLSPCLVSNFHMAPSFFTAWQGEDIPLWNTIDLLIVDEAGQVSADVGAAMFALAKRALVVGDTHQIEPVWNIGEAGDRANAVKFGLISNARDTRYDVLAEGGYTSASGSLMRIANRSCSTRKYEDMRGLMLTEHRRCVPELIRFCNELVYANRLEPKRASISPADRILPAFGYLHVSGRDKKIGGSRQNYDEARAIVEWLKAHRESIERHYAGKSGATAPLWKLVGIVTPFAAQAGTIERLLRKEMPDLMRKDGRLTVGTVHALQGAERAIVILSPTYGESFVGGAFFDQKANMLNVAVSRAKDSFLVFGNLALFDASRRSIPSGRLAAFLFGQSGSALSLAESSAEVIG